VFLALTGTTTADQSADHAAPADAESDSDHDEVGAPAKSYSDMAS
jgi:hypothetical protein